MPRGRSRSNSPCSTSTVARASSSARWVGEVVAEKYGARVASLQLGTSSRVSNRRARTAVSTDAAGGQASPFSAHAALRKPMSNGALWATRTAPRANSRNAGSTAPIRGAVATIVDVIPVSTLMYGGISRPGSTRVWNSPSTTPPRTLTAPISVIALSFGEPPVVSRSTTTKVTSASGVPSSSIVTCSNRWSVRCGGAGEEGTGRTVGRGNDTPVMPRRSGHRARRRRTEPRGWWVSPGRGGIGALTWRNADDQDSITPNGPRQRYGGPRTRRGGLMLARSRRRTPGTAARTAITVLAVAGLAAAAQPAAAAPSDQPGGTSAVLDSRALDALQQRAAEVQAGLQEQEAGVVAAREELSA